MSDLIDIPAALAASPRPCAPVAGVRPFADDAQPRPLGRFEMTAPMAWRLVNGTTKRGYEAAAQRTTQDGHTADGGTYVTSKHSIRSGSSTSRPPA